MEITISDRSDASVFDDYHEALRFMEDRLANRTDKNPRISMTIKNGEAIHRIYLCHRVPMKDSSVKRLFAKKYEGKITLPYWSYSSDREILDIFIDYDELRALKI